MNEQYDFEEHLELYKDLYMHEGFAEEDAEALSLNLMRACGIKTEPFYEKYSGSRKSVH